MFEFLGLFFLHDFLFLPAALFLSALFVRLLEPEGGEYGTEDPAALQYKERLRFAVKIQGIPCAHTLHLDKFLLLNLSKYDRKKKH